MQNEDAVAPIPEQWICQFCDEPVANHFCGTAKSCGDCCESLGSLAQDQQVYQWIWRMVSRKNERIAQAEQRATKAEAERDHENKFKIQYLSEKTLEKIRADKAQAENTRLREALMHLEEWLTKYPRVETNFDEEMIRCRNQLFCTRSPEPTN